MSEGAKLPKVTHEGPLMLAGVTIPCVVLDTGDRVITQTGFLEALARSKKAKGQRKTVSDQLPVFLAAENLKPLAEAILTTPTNPVLFRRKKGGISYGYYADLLPEVCEVFLKAREQEVLLSHQLPIADRCEKLLRGLAKIGITALIDEATGYQEVRDRQALQKLLEKWVTGDFAKWTKTFPDAYYEHLFRLLKWPYPTPGGARPGYVGTLTNELVYKRLPPGVLDELRRVNPSHGGKRKRKFFQHLTSDIGNPHLREHLAALIATMKPARDWKDFERAFRIVFGDGLEQLEFDTSLDEAAPGVQPPEEVDDTNK